MPRKGEEWEGKTKERDEKWREGFTSNGKKKIKYLAAILDPNLVFATSEKFIWTRVRKVKTQIFSLK